MLGSGGGNERRPLGFWEAHAFGQVDAEAVEERRLGGIGLRHAAHLPNLQVCIARVVTFSECPGDFVGIRSRIARSKKRLDPATVNRQIGRILQQNQRAAARFALALEPDDCPAGLFDNWATLSRGRLSPALEHQRLERPAAVEGLHPAHSGRSRLSRRIS
jgi:hypothetical protein